MLDQVTGMRVFSRVVTTGGFSPAARALGMSQSMATKHVDAIENRLGVKLLHRSTRRLTLTEAGRQYLDTVERVLADLDETEAAVASQRIEARGTLRASVPVSFGVRRIAPLMPRFAASYPQLHVELGLNDRMIDLVEEGWDLAVRIGRLRSTDALTARRLASSSMVVCAAPAYLERRGIPRTVAELGVEHDCLGYTLSADVGSVAWTFGRDSQVKVQISGSLSCNNGDALLAAALAGQGIVYQPAFIVSDEVAAGRLIALTLDYPTVEPPGIFAVYPSERRPPAKVRVFLDFLAAELSHCS